MSHSTEEWFVYLLQGRQQRLYCDITTDLERRVHEHNNNQQKASKCAWACRPLKLVWFHPVVSRRAAQRIEAKIKRLKRSEKLSLIQGEICIDN